MSIIPQIAEAMQIVLTTTADMAGRLSGFVKRERKLTGSGFVQTLVFGWLAKPDASLEELTQTAASVGIEISPQGLDFRFTKDASECLKQTLEVAVGTLIADNPVTIPILQRFNGVYIQDSSIVVLPDELKDIWQGCGGSSEKNTIRRFVVGELRSICKVAGSFEYEHRRSCWPLSSSRTSI